MRTLAYSAAAPFFLARMLEMSSPKPFATPSQRRLVARTVTLTGPCGLCRPLTGQIAL
jgi:hypothetical protein